jgi:uncharacterized membrane protein
MERIKSFVRTTLIGGIAIILPVAILVVVFTWIFRRVTDLIQPATNWIVENLLAVDQSWIAEGVADILVIVAIVFTCFLVGLVVKTRVGRWLHVTVENRFLRSFPGYSIVKETVLQFIGSKKTPFSTVALVQLFDSQTLCTAFITDTHPDGSCTVFVPTGPNPTSGQIFHLQADRVHTVGISPEEAMRSIISCGAGSTKLINAYHELQARLAAGEEAPPLPELPAEPSGDAPS